MSENGPISDLARFLRLEKRPSGAEDAKARLNFPRLAVTELGEVDIAPRITHMATGVDGWLQLPTKVTAPAAIS